MKVLVAGSTTWDNYSEIVRNMTLVLDEWVKSEPEDKKITFVHSGQKGAENMITEYIGKVERLIRQKGYSINEKVIGLRNFQNESNPSSARDHSMISSGADKVMIFQKQSCRRTEAFAKLVEAYEFPLQMVKE